MSENPVVGFVGVGLMGWGMAKNAVEKGYPIRVIAHRKREAVDDLVGRGAREVDEPRRDGGRGRRGRALRHRRARGRGDGGRTRRGGAAGAHHHRLLDLGARLTARLAAELAPRGITLIDAPLSRTPAHTWSGEATTYVGGPAELVEKWRPLLSTWASVVIPVGGPVGSAHAMKLINNLVALGYAAIWAECYGMVKKIGADPAVFREVISNSGMNCGNFQTFSKYAVEGDPNAHKFSIANGFKDLSYYSRLANKYRAATLMSDGALQTLKLGMAMGFGERFVPEVGDIVLALNDPPRGD